MRMPLLIALAPCALFAQSRIINVADFGVVPGKDASFAVNALLETVASEPNVTLVFPKGQYEFYPERAKEEYRAVSNHDNSLKRMAFPIFGANNLTIDGGGSLFMFHGRISPFVLDGVRGATLKNFSIDWSRSFQDEYTIVANNEKDKTFTIEVDPKKYPVSLRNGQLLSDRYDWQDEQGSNMVFDPATRSPIYNTLDYSINFSKPYKAVAAGKNRYTLNASTRKSLPPVGSVLVTYGTHPTSRLCPAIHAANSSDLTIEDVTVYNAGGMALIADRVENIHLNRMSVTSTDERLVSTRADATHFIGCKGMINVENCLFEHMLDDAINVHGAYIKIDEYLGKNQFACSISHFQQWGLVFAEPGDRVALLSRTTILPFFATTVTNVKPINETVVLVTVADVPEDLPKGPLSMENLTWNPDFIFRKNIVRENRARSILVTTKGKVLIEGNYLSSQMHGILIEGDNNKWYESGAVQDITIRNNTFVNMGYEATDRYPLYASPLLTADQRFGEGRYHRNIHFVNNTLKSFNGHMVFAQSVDGLVISGNTMEFSEDYPAYFDYPAIDLRYCENVVIDDNKAVGFDRPSKIAVSKDSEKVSIKQNKGFDSQSRTDS